MGQVTGGREAHRDAGGRVKARDKGAWAKVGQDFTVYKAHP